MRAFDIELQSRPVGTILSGHTRRPLKRTVTIPRLLALGALLSGPCDCASTPETGVVEGAPTQPDINTLRVTATAEARAKCSTISLPR
jgi:hypothetical protein